MKFIKAIFVVAVSVAAIAPLNAVIQNGIVIPNMIHVFNDTSVEIVIDGKPCDSLAKVSLLANNTGRLSIQNDSGIEIGRIEYPVQDPDVLTLESYDHLNCNFSEIMDKDVCARLHPDMIIISIAIKDGIKTARIRGPFMTQ